MNHRNAFHLKLNSTFQQLHCCCYRWFTRVCLYAPKLFCIMMTDECLWQRHWWWLSPVGAALLSSPLCIWSRFQRAHFWEHTQICQKPEMMVMMIVSQSSWWLMMLMMMTMRFASPAPETPAPSNACAPTEPCSSPGHRHSSESPRSSPSSRSSLNHLLFIFSPERHVVRVFPASACLWIFCSAPGFGFLFGSRASSP